MSELAEPVGRKLAKAREAKGLTLEEAGLQTKIRPNQLAALESDDYSVFASNTYARGFLQIYGKFLGIDVRAVARQLEAGSPISISDYQYLNAAPAEAPAPTASYRESDSRRPSLAPLVVFVLLLAALGFGFHLFYQAKRLEPGPTLSVAEGSTDATSSAPSATPTPEAAVTSASPVSPEPIAAPPANQNSPATAFTTNPAPSVPAAPQRITEVIIDAVKKTWVRVRLNDPTTQPIFEDDLYPASTGDPSIKPLRLTGTRFFIEVREANAVTVRKDGQLLSCQPPGVTIE
jgi:cytoskeleton protein RodZ